MTVQADWREAVWSVFELIAQERQADPKACLQAWERAAEAEAAVGEPEASVLRSDIADEWRRETGTNPYTGDPLDDGPALDGEPSRAWRKSAWAKRRDAEK